MQHVFFDMRLTCIGLRVGKGKCAYCTTSSSGPSGQRLPSVLWFATTRSILLFPGWDTCPMQGYPQN